jgi:hypothetical protein
VPESTVTPTDELVGPARSGDPADPLDALGASGDEVPSLLNTLTNDASPTHGPLSAGSSWLIRRPDPGARRRLQVALASALAVVGTLVGLAVVAALWGR